MESTLVEKAGKCHSGLGFFTGGVIDVVVTLDARWRETERAVVCCSCCGSLDLLTERWCKGYSSRCWFAKVCRWRHYSNMLVDFLWETV